MNRLVVAKVIVFSVYTLFLAWRAFGPKVGFASWHMFANVLICRFELRINNGAEGICLFNPWDYLPHSHLFMSSDEMKFFLFYLRRIHKLSLEGNVYVREGLNTRTIRVKDSHVVD